MKPTKAATKSPGRTGISVLGTVARDYKNHPAGAPVAMLILGAVSAPTRRLSHELLIRIARPVESMAEGLWEHAQSRAEERHVERVLTALAWARGEPTMPELLARAFCDGLVPRKR